MARGAAAAWRIVLLASGPFHRAPRLPSVVQRTLENATGCSRWDPRIRRTRCCAIASSNAAWRRAHLTLQRPSGAANHVHGGKRTPFLRSLSNRLWIETRGHESPDREEFFLRCGRNPSLVATRPVLRNVFVGFSRFQETVRPVPAVARVAEVDGRAPSARASTVRRRTRTDSPRINSSLNSSLRGGSLSIGIETGTSSD